MHLDSVSAALSKLDKSTIKEISSIICNSIFKGKSSLFLCGNGGSHSIATHLATDLQKIGMNKGYTPKIFTLGSNLSLLTAIANDLKFEEVFSRELINLGKKGDILLSISSSGASPNILNALKVAKQIGLFNITFSGFSNAPCLSFADCALDLELDSGEYEISEDVHATACHAIAIQIKETLH